MKEISHKIGEICRFVLAVAFLGVLVSAAGDATGRLTGEISASLGWNSTDVGTETGVEASTSDSARPDNVPSDNMTHDSRRDHRSASSQITAVILQWDKSESRPRLTQDSECAPASPASTCCGGQPLLTNACQVSSSLGRQFTLVGARPSGTS